MSERDLDDLFRELGNEKPYWGSDEWRVEMEKNKKARQIFQDFAKGVKMGEYCDELETRSQLAALGYIFEPWYAEGWHRP